MPGKRRKPLYRKVVGKIVKQKCSPFQALSNPIRLLCCSILRKHPCTVHQAIMSSSLQDLKQLLTSKDGISKRLLLRDLHEIIVGAETPEETATRM